MTRSTFFVVNRTIMTDSLHDQLRQAYDGGAEERDSRTLADWRLAERDHFLRQLRERRCITLLEIGAGVGRDAQYFADHGCDVTCIDLSSEMVKRCHARGQHALVMDVMDLSFEDGTFDAAYSVNCLLHLSKAELPLALRNIQRVLRPGGVFYYGTWGGFEHEGVYEDDHLNPPRFFSFHEDEPLLQVVGEAFEVLEFRSMNPDPTDERFRFQAFLLRKLGDTTLVTKERETSWH